MSDKVAATFHGATRCPYCGAEVGARMVALLLSHAEDDRDLVCPQQRAVTS